MVAPDSVKVVAWDRYPLVTPIYERYYMAYVPLNKNVIIERKAPEKISAGGIILQSSLEPDRAIVIATGDESVKVGEELLLNWNKAYKIENETYRIHIDDVVAVYED